MITKTVAFQVGERFFPCIVDAQKHEIAELLKQNKFGEDIAASVSEIIMGQQEKILDILTMTPDSRPKARKINGGTKKRRKKDGPETATPADSNALERPY